MTTKVCTECGDPAHSYCNTKNGAKFILGHEEYFGKIVGKCPVCNSLIGSAQGKCTSSHCTGIPLDSYAAEKVPKTDEPFKDCKVSISPVVFRLGFGAKTYEGRCTQCGKTWNHATRWDKDPRYPGTSVEEIDHTCNWFRVQYFSLKRYLRGY